MKRLLWLSVVVSSACAHAEWLTLVGNAGDASSDFIQVEPTSVETIGDARAVRVRVNRSREVVGADNIRYRSFEGDVSVDCVQRRARYVRGVYYAEPNFSGTPAAEKVFSKQDNLPMRFKGFVGDYPARVIRAACSNRER